MRFFFIPKLARKKKKPDKLGVHEGLGKPAFVGTVGGMYSSVSSGDTLAKGISMTVDKLCEATAPWMWMFTKERMKTAEKWCEWKKDHYGPAIPEKENQVRGLCDSMCKHPRDRQTDRGRERQRERCVSRSLGKNDFFLFRSFSRVTY